MLEINFLYKNNLKSLSINNKIVIIRNKLYLINKIKNLNAIYYNYNKIIIMKN